MTLDCTGAFHRLKLSPDAAKKNAFITHLGKFGWKVAPFGTTPIILLKGNAGHTVDWNTDHLRQVFEQFQSHNMKLKLAKCKFLRDKIHFLGQVINHEGIRTSPEKTKEISKIKSPACIDEARALLGLLNYYHRFIPAFADLMQPIQKLLKRNVKFEWTANCEKVFNLAKERLAQDPMLYHPDPNKPWIIEVDASKTALASILLQPHETDGVTQEVPVMFISYNFTGMQQSWSTTERELYTIFVAVRKLYYMINSGRVTIRIDHRPLLKIAAGTAKVQN